MKTKATKPADQIRRTRLSTIWRAADLLEFQQAHNLVLISIGSRRLDPGATSTDVLALRGTMRNLKLITQDRQYIVDRIEIFPGTPNPIGSTQRWYWRAIARNGQVVADGAEPYASAGNVRAIVIPLAGALGVPVFERPAGWSSRGDQ